MDRRPLRDLPRDFLEGSTFDATAMNEAFVQTPTLSQPSPFPSPSLPSSSSSLPTSPPEAERAAPGIMVPPPFLLLCLVLLLLLLLLPWPSPTLSGLRSSSGSWRSLSDARRWLSDAWRCISGWPRHPSSRWTTISSFSSCAVLILPSPWRNGWTPHIPPHRPFSGPLLEAQRPEEIQIKQIKY